MSQAEPVVVDRVGPALRGAGELLITLGLVILLFVGYELWWTNFSADQQTANTERGLRDEWAGAPPPATPEYGKPHHIDLGKGFALLWIPRIHLTVPVVEGVTLDDLARGVGHYPGTAMPGEIGNFSIAGHRATHGEPFRNLDQVRPGDLVVVETVDAYYTYRVDSVAIVEPTQVSVILPVPNQPGAQPTRRLMTLTTCNPRWASTQRLIIYTHLFAEQDKLHGVPPALKGMA